MKEEKIRSCVLASFREKEVLKNIGENDDFFDLGVSSLTIVELQIVIEKELKITVETSHLMRSPSMASWMDIYVKKLQESASEKVT